MDCRIQCSASSGVPKHLSLSTSFKDATKTGLLNVAPIELARQWGATDLSYALALADFCSGDVRATSAFPPKYNRYER